MNCCCDDEKHWENIFGNDSVDLSLMNEIINRYKGETGSLISVLQQAQDIYGYLPLTVLLHIARELEVKPAKVYGVATFYTQFRLNPVGKHLILLCQGTACHVNGAEAIQTALCEELKIKEGETTDDGIFTLDTAACLGCCSLAPVMMIDGQAYGPLTPEKAVKIIRDLYAAEKESTGEGENI